MRPFTDGYAVLRPHLEYIQIKDALAADGTVTVGRATATASSSRPSGRCATTASTGSSRWNRTSADVHALGGFSGPELFTRAHAAFTELLRPKESSTHEQRRTGPHRPAQVRHRRRRRHRQAARQGDHRAGRPGRAGRRRRRRPRPAPRRWPPSAAAGPTPRWPTRWPAEQIDVVVVCTPDRAPRRGRHRGAGRRQARDHREAGRGDGREDRRDHRGPARGRARWSRSSRSTGSTRPPRSPSRPSRPASSAGSPPASRRSTGGAARATTTPATGAAPGSSTAAAR